MTKEFYKEKANELVVIVGEIVDCYTMSERKICEGHGITQGEGRLIAKMNLEDQYYVNFLAEELDLSKSRISRLVESLRKKGIIDKTENEEDHRYNNIVLTQKGKDIRNAFLVDRINRCIEIISPIDQKNIETLLPQLYLLRTEFIRYKNQLKASSK